MVRSAMPGRVAIGMWPQAVVDHVLVDLVGDRDHVVPLAQLGDGLELAEREDLARGVVGAVEDDRPRAGTERPRQPIGVEREVRRLQRHEDGLGAGDDRPRPVVLVERLEDDDLVAGVQDGEERRQHRLGRAAAHGHLALRWIRQARAIASMRALFFSMCKVRPCRSVSRGEMPVAHFPPEHWEEPRHFLPSLK